MDPVPAVVEEWVNHWLEQEAGNVHIAKTETTAVRLLPDLTAKYTRTSS